MCFENAAEHIRKLYEFGLEDKFCDAQELKDSYSNTHIPDVLLSFFATLFTINQTMPMKESLKEDETSLYDDDEEDYVIESGQHKRLNLKMKAIFQILLYQVAHCRKNTPLHILNAHAIMNIVVVVN